MPTPAGVAVTILAVGGVIMTVRADSFSKPERVIWIFIAVFLFWVERNSINGDRVATEVQHRLDMAEQQREFSDSESASNLRFERTMRGVSGVFGKTKVAADTAKHAVDALTGGASYLWIWPAPEGPGTYQLMADVHGEYSVWDVLLEGANMTGNQFPNRGTERFSVSLGTVSPTYARPIGQTIHPDPNLVNVYQFTVFSRQDPEILTMSVRYNRDLKSWESKNNVFRSVRSTRDHPPTKKQTDIYDEPWIRMAGASTPQ
jgi:hypothetical protein